MPRRILPISLVATMTLIPAAIATSAPPRIEVMGGSLASITGSASPYGVSQARGASLAARHSAADGGVRVRLLGVAAADGADATLVPVAFVAVTVTV
jgi:ABC-type branched-subunit amino acid transport system substrate-binding protein